MFEVGNVKISQCLAKYDTMKTYWGSGSIAPIIRNLGARWRWVVSFTLRPLYPRAKRPLYMLDRRLSGPQSRFGRGVKEKCVELNEKRVTENLADVTSSTKTKDRDVLLPLFTFTCTR
jgi:hypothetical protein